MHDNPTIWLGAARTPANSGGMVPKFGKRIMASVQTAGENERRFSPQAGENAHGAVAAAVVAAPGKVRFELKPDRSSGL